MGWRQRLAELVLVGAAACDSSSGAVLPDVNIPACNANPDPCCLMPGTALCNAYTACATDGGFPLVNGSDVTCSFPPRPDAGRDAP